MYRPTECSNCHQSPTVSPAFAHKIDKKNNKKVPARARYDEQEDDYEDEEILDTDLPAKLDFKLNIQQPIGRQTIGSVVENELASNPKGKRKKTSRRKKVPGRGDNGQSLDQIMSRGKRSGGSKTVGGD